MGHFLNLLLLVQFTTLFNRVGESVISFLSTWVYFTECPRVLCNITTMIVHARSRTTSNGWAVDRHIHLRGTSIIQPSKCTHLISAIICIVHIFTGISQPTHLMAFQKKSTHGVNATLLCSSLLYSTLLDHMEKLEFYLEFITILKRALRFYLQISPCFGICSTLLYLFYSTLLWYITTIHTYLPASLAVLISWYVATVVWRYVWHAVSAAAQLRSYAVFHVHQNSIIKVSNGEIYLCVAQSI